MHGIASDKGFDAGWVLIYTSAIMLVLRLFAGSVLHQVSPLALLTISCVLAIFGLYFLSISTGCTFLLLQHDMVREKHFSGLLPWEWSPSRPRGKGPLP
ncbi:hypothetical protein [Arenibacter palladensis]|uniref:hypothetical protein n=1 Tax=Arenibacter palladensis TaxID=237373 RepID=UPI0026E21BBC|nr:hypothetical protein [Arenibacter palladensis]MDO6605644.1 hypothetical protein [Arenibacter palladensis]